MLEERFTGAKDSRDEGHWYSLEGKNLLSDILQLANLYERR